MLLVTETARVVCAHELGAVQGVATQALVSVGGRRVFVEGDLESKPVAGCPNTNASAGMKPCTTTLKAMAGHSNLVSIEGRRVCLDVLTGLTDGTPPAAVSYVVRTPGQEFVSADG